MSTAELRKKLIEKIQLTEDQEILKEATRLLEIQLHELDEPFQLTSKMETAIDESEIQFQNGEFLNHDEANNQIDEWLEK